MGPRIKARYGPLDLPPLHRFRFLAMPAITKQKDARYCLQIFADAMEALQSNDIALVIEAFQTRNLATEAICLAVPYDGPLDAEARTVHVRACLTIGWAIGMREERYQGWLDRGRPSFIT